MKKKLIQDAVKRFKEWKGDRDNDYVYDEIHEFTVDFSRGELADLMFFLEKNERILTAAPDLLNALIKLRDAVKQVPEMNHSKYDALGVEVNAAIQKATL